MCWPLRRRGELWHRTYACESLLDCGHTRGGHTRTRCDPAALFACERSDLDLRHLHLYHALPQRSSTLGQRLQTPSTRMVADTPLGTPVPGRPGSWWAGSRHASTRSGSLFGELASDVRAHRECCVTREAWLEPCQRTQVQRWVKVRVRGDIGRRPRFVSRSLKLVALSPSPGPF